MSWFNRLFRGEKKATPTPTITVESLLRDARLQEQSGLLDHAITTLRTALQQAPRDLRILQDLGIILMKAKRYDEAERTWENVLKLDADAAAAFYALAFLKLRKQEFSTAIQYLSQFLSNPPLTGDTTPYREYAQTTLGRLNTARGGTRPATPAPRRLVGA
jgi:tetratricopeptide (TPR) repeat protein